MSAETKYYGYKEACRQYEELQDEENEALEFVNCLAEKYLELMKKLKRI